MADSVKVEIEGQVHEFPVMVGSEGEKAIDISDLRARTGYITMDPAYMNTGAATSAITFLDGEQGILRYRGIPIEQVAEQSSFTETAYLLIYGHLPNRTELLAFRAQISRHSMIHEGLKELIDRFRRARTRWPSCRPRCAPCRRTTRNWPRWTRRRTRWSCPSCA